LILEIIVSKGKAKRESNENPPGSGSAAYAAAAATGAEEATSTELHQIPNATCSTEDFGSSPDIEKIEGAYTLLATDPHQMLPSPPHGETHAGHVTIPEETNEEELKRQEEVKPSATSTAAAVNRAVQHAEDNDANFCEQFLHALLGNAALSAAYKAAAASSLNVAVAQPQHEDPTNLALSFQEIEAEVGATLIFCGTGPAVEGSDAEDCISCSEFGSEYRDSSSGGDGELELGKLIDEEAAPPPAGKKGIWGKVRRGLLSMVPKPRLACLLMVAAPVLD